MPRPAGAPDCSAEPNRPVLAPPELRASMFEHITILLSFVYALAVSHLLTSATELMWARDRVRLS
jgi:hypothetical protein